MNLIEELSKIGERAEKVGNFLETEEATKTSLILPFISAIGYDIHDPTEVTPEFTADVGIKKGEKVDYAIVVNDKVRILIECKKYGTDLDKYTGQLFRYFTVTDAKIAILTDGVVYKFYSDLDESNKLDELPFYTLNLKNVNETVIRELPKITKQYFDPDGFLLVAQDLKYINEIKNLLEKEFREPTWLIPSLIPETSFKGTRTKSNVNWFTDLTKKAIKKIQDDYIRHRLNLPSEMQQLEVIVEEDVSEVDVPTIETTMEEYEGYYYIKSIASEIVDPNRVVMKDTLSYCGVLLDDNVRKTICRLRFNNLNRKVINIGNSSERVPINNVIEILKYRNQLVERIRNCMTS